MKTTARSLLSFALAALLPLGPAVALLAIPATAQAQADQQQTIDKVVELNREAVALYQKKKFDNARKLLKQALDLCEAAGLDRHPVAARTHVHLGIVIVGGFGQREIGAKQFSAALQIQPDIALTPGVASPAVQDLFNETAVAISPRAPGATTAAAPEPEAAPAAAQATDEPAPAAAAPARDAAEAPRVERRPAPQARAESDEDSDDDDDDASGAPRSRIQLGALLGAGVGWASGMGDVNADVPVPGSFAAAKLGHVVAEVGYWLDPTLMLSLQGRLQKVSGPTVIQANNHTYQPASGATAIFAAATWSPFGNKGRLRPFLTGALGGGRIRHVVTLSALKDCGPMRNQTCVDTVAAGPLLVGAGGGVVFDLGERLGLVATVQTQVGAPKFTFNIDFNAGVVFRL